MSIEMVVAGEAIADDFAADDVDANYQSLVDRNSGGLLCVVGARSSKKTWSRASSATVSPAITSATNGGWGAV